MPKSKFQMSNQYNEVQMLKMRFGHFDLGFDLVFVI